MNEVPMEHSRFRDLLNCTHRMGTGLGVERRVQSLNRLLTFVRLPADDGLTGCFSYTSAWYRNTVLWRVRFARILNNQSLLSTVFVVVGIAVLVVLKVVGDIG